MNLKAKTKQITFVQFDSAEYMKTYIQDGSVQLVYLDPPFFSQKSQSQYNKSQQKNVSFNDKWKSKNEYLEFIRKIIIECRNKMNDSALIFLHCDTSANHLLRMLLDEIFGDAMFLNEIIWSYKRWSNSSNKLLDAHQTIWVYSKTKNYKFNRIFTSYSPTTNIDQILQQRERNGNGVVVYKRNDDDSVVGTTKKNGVPLRDVWEIPFLNPKAKERVGYPTQKPVELLKRIIQLSCDQNDLILDPFCGSGSLGIAASILGCKYIGIDISQDAIDICNNRINEYSISESQVIDGNYSLFNNLEKEIRDFINEVDGLPIERNRGLDGIYSSNEGLIGIRFQRPDENLSETVSLIKKAAYEKPLVKRIVIKTHDNDLFEPDCSDITIIESMKYRFLKEIIAKQIRKII